MFDLKNDKTDIKYRELEFIETLVNDNYLSYQALEKRTNCYLVKPLEAFKNIESENESVSFNGLFDDLDLSLLTRGQRNQIKDFKSYFYNQKLDFGLSQTEDLPDDLLIQLKKIFPIGTSSMTLLQLSECMVDLLTSMKEDKSIYKGLRNISHKYLNSNKFSVKYDEVDFNDDLKNSIIRKTFIEYVNNSLNPNGDKEITDYDFYVNAYFSLDLLGISKEPSKSVKFENMLNDGYHSYYGAFCDYVVSDDDGFLKKTKVMYRLLGIDTDVLHIDDFIPFFGLASKQEETSINKFNELLINDLKNGIVLNSKSSIKFDRRTTTIKPHHKYLGYFNLIDSIRDDNQDYIYLYRKVKNYSDFLFYREYEGIINKAIKLFGNDYNNLNEFNWETEIKEIKESKWAGRLWDFGSFTILIDVNTGTRNLGLLITPKK